MIAVKGAEASVLVRVPRRNRTNRIEKNIKKEIYSEGRAHIIVEAEKSSSLPPASWRPRRASGLVPVQTHRPETQGMLMV